MSILSNFSQSLPVPRITTKYKRLMILASLLVLIMVGVSSWYVSSIKQDNKKTLARLAQMEKLAEHIQYDVVQTERDLNRLLLAPDAAEARSPLLVLQKAIDKSADFLRMAGLSDKKFNIELTILTRLLKRYKRVLTELLALRQDLNWLYPALPYINGTLLNANLRYDTAVEHALDEISSSNDQSYKDKVYFHFIRANDLWQRVILNFRAMLVRFSGLQNVPLGASEEETNVYVYMDELEKYLTELELLRQKGELEIQAEESLDIMSKALAEWRQGFKKIRNLRLSIYWRADLQFVDTTIKPVQNDVLARLVLLDEIIEVKSMQEVNNIDQVLDQLILEYWLVLVFIIVIFVAVYRYMQRLILQPMARVSEALWAESQGKAPTSLSIADTVEMNQLVEAFSAMRRQVSDRQQALEYQALHDALTTLPNRVLLSDRLEQQIQVCHRDDSQLALFILDLNGFKDVNDTLGHQVGDMVLIQVAERIKQQIRSKDTIARLGGDEFAILVVDANERIVEEMTNRLGRCMSEHLEISGHNLHVSASIGIALYPEHGSSAKILIQRADVAMYIAKRSRTLSVIYDRKQDTHNVGWLTLPAELETALMQNELQLFYQPKIAATNGAVVGVEALLRWQHPRHGWMNPEDVIELAETTGMIGRLTQWVIDKALFDLVQLQQSGLKLNMAVNLSPHNLHDFDFVKRVPEILAKHDVDAKALILEITENAFIADTALVINVIHQFRDLGINVAIDDYGTGFSSLSYLRQLSVNELKIDKTFVMNLDKDSDDMTIVHSTISMAQSLGLEVVAEGVENIASLEILRDLGCNVLQGYYISKPVAYADLVSWITQWEPNKNAPFRVNGASA